MLVVLSITLLKFPHLEYSKTIINSLASQYSFPNLSKCFISSNIFFYLSLYRSLKTIWEYCTYKWLVKTNLDRTRIERSSTDERWEIIQHAFDNCQNKSFITVAEQKEIEASSLIPGIMGYLTSYGAKIGVKNYNNVMQLFSKRGNEYLYNKDTSFDKEVIEKRVSRIYALLTCDDNYLKDDSSNKPIIKSDYL